MDCSFYKKGTQCEYIEMHTRQEIHRIRLEEVLYFSSDVRIVEVHLVEGTTYRFYGKLDEVQQVLRDTFLRCHQSFLVNKNKISRITRKWVWVQEQQIPVSRTYYVQMRQDGLLEGNGNVRTVSKENRAVKGRVRCISGKYQGSEFRIYPNEKLVLGRGYDRADIVLDDLQISREHCWIQYNTQADSYFVCNCSANGIMINDVWLEERDRLWEVRSGDRLPVGILVSVRGADKGKTTLLYYGSNYIEQREKGIQVTYERMDAALCLAEIIYDPGSNGFE